MTGPPSTPEPDLPAGFLFGVATSAFQCEGGFNGPGQPANNWAAWELSGRVEPSGPALDFWERYDDHLDRVAAIGCNAFRISVDWTRCEPRPGDFDEAAFARYGKILAACRSRGIEPVVALHHFVHPRWLGPDFWLRLDSPDRFGQWAAAVASRLGGSCRYWLTLNEINVAPFASYVTGRFPPGRRLRTGSAVRALGNMLAAHVLAHRALHRTDGAAVVSTNNHVLSVYELDRLLVDVLLAPSRGVERADLREWLASRRADYHAALPEAAIAGRAARSGASSALPLDAALPRAVAEVYRYSQIRPLDLVAIDYYDPRIAGRLRMPGRRAGGGRRWSPVREPFEDAFDPDALVTYCRLNHEPGLDLWIAENGLANRVTTGPGGPVSHPRPDRWTRARALPAVLGAVGRARAAGVPVSAYFHWTLADNYEWGSREPRFGLHRVDEPGGAWGELDAFGGDAAGTYRRIITAHRAVMGKEPERSGA